MRVLCITNKDCILYFCPSLTLCYPDFIQYMCHFLPLFFPDTVDFQTDRAAFTEIRKATRQKVKEAWVGVTLLFIPGNLPLFFFFFQRCFPYSERYVPLYEPHLMSSANAFGLGEYQIFVVKQRAN